MDEVTFIRDALATFYTKSWHNHVAQKPPYARKGRGVPPQMFDGPVDSEGWVEWRLLLSPISGTDIVALETEFRISLPPFYRSYLRSYCHIWDQLQNGRVFLSFNAIPVDDPLGPLRSELEAWQDLIPDGYVAIAQYEDGWGPLCFDTLRQDAASDYPLVWLDHELLPTENDPNHTRTYFEKLAKPVYRSFRELFEDQFIVPSDRSKLAGDGT